MKQVLFIASIIFTSPAYSSEQVDKIIEVLRYKENLQHMLADLQLPSPTPDSLEENSQYNEMAHRHKLENKELFDNHFTWSVLYPDIVLAIENTYSADEINAFYTFISSESGASFFSKLSLLQNTYSEVLSKSLASYEQQYMAISNRHTSELNKLLEEKNISTPSPKEGETEKTTIGDVVRFMVATENGQMIGYKVRAGANPTFYQASPFEDGDIVVSANGINLNEPSNVRELYQTLKTTRQIHFEIYREEKSIDFLLDLSAFDKDL